VLDLLARFSQSDGPRSRNLSDWVRGQGRLPAAARAKVIERAEDLLRRQAVLDRLIARHGQGSPQTPALRLALLLAVEEGIDGPALARRWRQAPPPLTPPDGPVGQMLSRVAKMGKGALTDASLPASVRLGFPDWLGPELDRSLGQDRDRQLGAMLLPPALHLRANSLKTTRDGAITLLAADGISADPLPLSPAGLSAPRGVDIARASALRQGVIEVQDESSQLAGLLAGAAPGQMVIDLCAGAGGKALVLAAEMANKGRLFLSDASPGRLKRAGERLARAGVSNHQIVTADAAWTKRHKAKADLVLIDAPCSGTGTWRRHPDARWRLRPDDLAELPAIQDQLLDQGARLVRPGGRLIYVTCSLLRVENEDRTDAFLSRHPDFAALAGAAIWARRFPGTACPGRQSPHGLALLPAEGAGDGFFIAVFERR